VSGEAGLARIAPEGGAVAAVLVLTGAAAGAVRLRLANMAAGTITIDAPTGVEVAAERVD
jgi:hypothetical protein